MSKKFKRNNVGDMGLWQFSNGEGGQGIITKREPYKYWATCDETGRTVEINLMIRYK